MLRIFAFIQKGFPQLLDTHTAANSDLRVYQFISVLIFSVSRAAAFS